MFHMFPCKACDKQHIFQLVVSLAEHILSLAVLIRTSSNQVSLVAREIRNALFDYLQNKIPTFFHVLNLL